MPNGSKFYCRKEQRRGFRVHGLLFAKPAHEIEAVLRAAIVQAGRVERQQLAVFIDLDLLVVSLWV